MTPLAELLGESPGIAAVRQKIGQLLQRQTDARRLPPILIQGETGTGKGLLARNSSRMSSRRCGSTPPGPSQIAPRRRRDTSRPSTDAVLFTALRIPKYIERTEAIARECGIDPVTA